MQSSKIMDQVISSEIYSNGKHTDENLTTREGIVLIPQPSDDTNNPLVSNSKLILQTPSMRLII